MSEYIDRETAIKNIKEHQCRNCSDIGLCGNCAVLTAIKLFENIPAAYIQPVKHGKWLSKEYMYGNPNFGIEDMLIDRLAEQSDGYAYCYICGKYAGYTAGGNLILSNYCSNCGAKMDNEQEIWRRYCMKTKDEVINEVLERHVFPVSTTI